MPDHREHRSVRQRYQKARQTEPGREDAIISELKDHTLYIIFNRPKRFNAFTTAMYDRFTDLLMYANELPEIKFIVVKGRGDNYSSGNDLANFTNPHYSGITDDIYQMALIAAEGLQKFCASIINSQKPIFAFVQGKVIGFAFTQLALYDRVFAVDNTEFHAPLVQIAQGPEMCASYAFPKIFGKSVGEDLIVKGNKVSASFLAKYNFVQTYPSAKEAEAALEKHLQELNQLEWQSYLTARKLFRENDRKQLLEVNERECKNLAQRWSNPDLPAHLVEYMAKIKAKSKL